MKTGLFVLLLVSVLVTEAKVKLPAILSDNMVLQQNSRVNLWGETDPGKTVRITTSWNDTCYRVTADRSGKWITQVTTPSAGGPFRTDQGNQSK